MKWNWNKRIKNQTPVTTYGIISKHKILTKPYLVYTLKNGLFPRFKITLLRNMTFNNWGQSSLGGSLFFLIKQFSLYFGQCIQDMTICYQPITTIHQRCLIAKLLKLSNKNGSASPFLEEKDSESYSVIISKIMENLRQRQKKFLVKVKTIN